jgi:hypothetical protein
MNGKATSGVLSVQPIWVRKTTPFFTIQIKCQERGKDTVKGKSRYMKRIDVRRHGRFIESCMDTAQKRVHGAGIFVHPP